jgi:hypothetical protein
MRVKGDAEWRDSGRILYSDVVSLFLMVRQAKTLDLRMLYWGRRSRVGGKFLRQGAITGRFRPGLGLGVVG